MKAMILSAGRGERMRPLTDKLPKPLLEVHNKALIVWHLENLAKAGFKEIVINIAHLGYKIPEFLGDGSRWGVSISYSDEQESGALESGGGIVKALPLLGNETFLVVNGDVFCDYTFDATFELKEGDLAHLILVKNPEHNPKGDFGFKEGRVYKEEKKYYTFSGIGYYSAELFSHLKVEKFSFVPLVKLAIEEKKISAELFSGKWHDIGTPQRLEYINKRDN